MLAVQNLGLGTLPAIHKKQSYLMNHNDDLLLHSAEVSMSHRNAIQCYGMQQC